MGSASEKSKVWVCAGLALAVLSSTARTVCLTTARFVQPPRV